MEEVADVAEVVELDGSLKAEHGFPVNSRAHFAGWPEAAAPQLFPRGLLLLGPAELLQPGL